MTTEFKKRYSKENLMQMLDLPKSLHQFLNVPVLHFGLSIFHDNVRSKSTKRRESIFSIPVESVSKGGCVAQV